MVFLVLSLFFHTSKRQRSKGWRKLYDRVLLHPFTTGQAQSAGLHPVPFTPHFRILGD